MKKLMLILPVAAIGFTGCVVYQPSPTAGQYGYTYDYQVPIAEGVPSPAYSSISTPRRTQFASTRVVADEIPAPPTTPPIVSSIPEMTPRPIIQNRSTTMVYPGASTFREAAGAQPGGAQQPAAGYPAGAGATTVVSGGFPFVVGSVTNTNNVPTNNIPTNNIPTNNIPTNNIPTNNIPTNNIPTNNIPTNNVPGQGTFDPLRPGGNINEGSGADIPQRIEPSTRLPAQPRLQQGQTPQSAPSPNTTSGGAAAPGQRPFSAGAAAPAQSQQQAPAQQPTIQTAPTGGTSGTGGGADTPAQP